MAKREAETEISFEKALQELEELVREMEEGNLDLDGSLAKFERGIVLSRICTQKLDQAEKKIDMLMCAENGEISLQPVRFTEEPDE
ncbi:MAG: exodeoxyribonuclease VII small subunit [Thermincola sp.]|jgi:exodeoxyribonuclease VII small subunit|nr:exodeoxyribonuclease VII small subunit [Thermincola sp.]MDT3703660.1 exodeoxyribonuclease VII small subunit [Thermincola sp.]